MVHRWSIEFWCMVVTNNNNIFLSPLCTYVKQVYKLYEGKIHSLLLYITVCLQRQGSYFTIVKMCSSFPSFHKSSQLLYWPFFCFCYLSDGFIMFFHNDASFTCKDTISDQVHEWKLFKYSSHFACKNI